MAAKLHSRETRERERERGGGGRGGGGSRKTREKDQGCSILVGSRFFVCFFFTPLQSHLMQILRLDISRAIQVVSSVFLRQAGEVEQRRAQHWQPLSQLTCGESDY